MVKHKRIGILLVNTGTPERPDASAVRVYLKRFLMDRRIVPMNRLAWWIILTLFILPKRKTASAEKYASIWTDEGSPFTLAHERLARGLRDHFDQRKVEVEIQLAMSYSSPLVPTGLQHLLEVGCTHLIILPLYPQSALSTTGSVRDGVQHFMKAHSHTSYKIIDNYYENPAYIRALAHSLQRAGFGRRTDDRVLFSYHSIPQIDVRAGDTYPAQTQTTSRRVAQMLEIDEHHWWVGYQCRFDKGRDWVGPFTRGLLEELAQKSASRLFFICPNFAVDCLETLYDIEHELKPHYQAYCPNSGLDHDDFIYVPCLGSSQEHVEALGAVLEPFIQEGCVSL